MTVSLTQQAPTWTLAMVRALSPCRDRYEVAKEKLPARKRFTAAEAREAGMMFSDIVWVAIATAGKDKDLERRLRMWMADCAARVLHVFESERPNDMRPRKAIEAARAYARGEITTAAQDAACAAGDAVCAACAAGDAACAAGDAACAARVAARAAWAAARDAAQDAERAWQFDRLIEWLSDSKPEPWPLPEVQS